MNTHCVKQSFLILAMVATLFTAQSATAQNHGISNYGTPALGADFRHLPYANPDAPTGGRIVIGDIGGFDTLNPHITGTAPWMLRLIGYESLMERSYDEPFTLYGLLAESIQTDKERTYAEFTLRKEARFSDGSPVTVEDVMWSHKTLGTVGHPRYRSLWRKISEMKQTGLRSIRFTFNTKDRELALIVGMRPILKKSQWEGKDFLKKGYDTIPISSAPYVVNSFEPGRSVTLKRNPEYWGKNLPIRRGTNVLDEIRFEHFRSRSAMFEAFKSGKLNTYREFDAETWDTKFNFPAIKRGDVVKSVIPHNRPSGITGFVMNTRRVQFKDWRVREAMLHVFNFELIEKTINGSVRPRITSYFSNSILGMRDGPAEGRVRELLELYKDELLPGALDGYRLPKFNGAEEEEKNIAKAFELFKEAGYETNGNVMIGPNGQPFKFEILIRDGSDEVIEIAGLFAKTLKHMGIAPKISVVDSTKFRERTIAHDFEMAYYHRALSLSPGLEQKNYWISSAAKTRGSYNWMGMSVLAADSMINNILESDSWVEHLASVRALDRILTTGRYVIPIYYERSSRIAHAKQLKFPRQLPMYGDWIGFQPNVWWYDGD